MPSVSEHLIMDSDLHLLIERLPTAQFKDLLQYTD